MFDRSFPDPDADLLAIALRVVISPAKERNHALKINAT